jgi:hypothetical protein
MKTFRCGIIIEGSLFADPVSDDRFFFQTQGDEPASLVDGAHPGPMNFLPMAGEPAGETLGLSFVDQEELVVSQIEKMSRPGAHRGKNPEPRFILNILPSEALPDLFFPLLGKRISRGN